MEDLFSLDTYNGTAGFVNRPASKERAMREAENRTVTDRGREVVRLLDTVGADGLTWNELGAHLGLHHGQISGCLTNLHHKGFVFPLRNKRDGSHIYISEKNRHFFNDAQLFLYPAKIGTKQTRKQLEQIIDAVQRCQRENYNLHSVENLNDLVHQLIIANDKNSEQN